MPSPEAPRLIPLTEWNKHHPWPPQGGLRHLVFHENTNGFKEACTSSEQYGRVGQ